MSYATTCERTTPQNFHKEISKLSTNALKIRCFQYLGNLGKKRGLCSTITFHNAKSVSRLCRLHSCNPYVFMMSRSSYKLI